MSRGLPASNAESRRGGRPATNRRIVLFSLVIVCLVVYNANFRLIAAGDSRPARLIPFAILTRRTILLDQFGPAPPGSHWFSHTPDGHLVSFYPVVLPVLITPLFVPAAIYATLASPDPYRFEMMLELMEKAAASLVATLSVVVIWLTLRRLTDERVALLLTAAYAFGTQTWSTSSQALWQHGLGQLLLAVSLYLLVRFGAASRPALLVGVLCGLMIFNRPPDVFFAAAIGAFYLVRSRRSWLPFALGAFLASLPFLVYNLKFFAKPLGGYQTLVGSGVFGHSIPEGVTAMLLSPGKGLFIFSPFLFFLVGGPMLRLGAAGRLPVLLLWLAFAAQLILFGRMDWRAGACYGPRFQTDVLPFLVLCLVPAVERLRRPLPLAVFVACVGFGVWVQAMGAFCFPAGGSYLLTQEQLWVVPGAQFLVEAKAGPARPEYLHRFAGRVKKLLHGGGKLSASARVVPTGSGDVAAAKGPASARVVRTGRGDLAEGKGSASARVIPAGRGDLAAGKGPTWFYTVAPCRLLDTRGPEGPFGGPALAAQSNRSFRVAGRCGISPRAKAVSLNVTATAPDTQGSLTLYPGDAPLPLASAVTYRGGQTRSNDGIFGLGALGDLAAYCDQDSGQVHVVLDVNGYYE